MVGDAEFGHALSLLDDAEIGQRCRSHFCHASCFHDDCGDRGSRGQGSLDKG